MKEFFEKVNFENNQQTTVKAWKITKGGNLYDYFLFQRQMGTEGNNLFHFSFQLLN